ncbi:MAG: hypothetical protein LBR52_00305 [Prevotellaceae bacterium]|jgi:hypothetical protein|nr:hypothetical protein [Prevotellaceae bacterium]
MKNTSIFITLLLCVCSSCKTPQYIPIETTRTEYRDNYLRDSIYFRDSIFFAIKGDTVFLEKYNYLYRDKIIRDSIFKTDTIRVPYPVEVVKEVKKPLSSWQNFQVWCGRILLAVVLLAIVYFVLKLKKSV